MSQHEGGPVWLFAYGSLIWRPECNSVERQRAWCMATTVACTCGPTSTAARRNAQVWCLAWTVAAPATALPSAWTNTICTTRSWPSGSAKCLIRLIARIGSAVVWMTAARYKRWVSCWSGTCRATPATCRIPCSARSSPAPRGAMAAHGNTWSRPQRPAQPPDARPQPGGAIPPLPQPARGLSPARLPVSPGRRRCRGTCVGTAGCVLP